MAAVFRTVADISNPTFKKIYGEGDNRILQNTPSAALNLVQKVNRTGAMGLGLSYAMVLAPASGEGPDLALAMENAQPAVVLEGVVSTWNKQYRHFGFEWEAMNKIATGPDVSAYFNTKQLEIDSGLKIMGENQAMAFWKDRHGDIGRLLSSGAVTWGALDTEVVFTMANKADLRKLHVNQKVELYTTRTDGTGTRRLKTTQWLVVTSINIAAGTVGLTLRGTGAVPATTERVNDGVTAGQAGDYLFFKDMRGKYSLGLADYIPLTDADIDASPTLNGIDRRKDRTRLAGGRVAWQQSYRATIDALISQIGDYNTESPDRILWMSPEHFDGLKTEAERTQLTVRYDDAVDLALGTKSVRVSTRFGSVNVALDAQAPSDRAYLLDMNAVERWFIGKAPIHAIDDNGLVIHRESTASDNWVMQFRSYTQIVMKHLATSGVMALS